MSYARRESVTVTVSSGGAATAYLPAAGLPAFTGRLINIIFVDTDLDAGSDFTLTVESTGQAIWSRTDSAADVTIAPRQSTHDTSGTVLGYTSDNDIPSDYIVLADDRIKIVIAQGGNEKSGTITAIIQ